MLYIGAATARNHETDEIYKAVNNEIILLVSLHAMKLANQSLSDASVQLKIPRAVNNVDIFLPDVVGFQNVPIAN